MIDYLDILNLLKIPEIKKLSNTYILDSNLSLDEIETTFSEKLFASHHSNWDEYIQCVENMGFQKIAIDHNDNLDIETEIMFKHKDYSIVLVANSFQIRKSKVVNSSYFYFNGSIKEDVDISYFNNIPLSRSNQYGTNIDVYDIDAREMPFYFLMKILFLFDIEEYFVNSNFYPSRITNKNQLLDNKAALDKIFSKSVIESHPLKFDFNSEFHKQVAAFFNSYNHKEKLKIFEHIKNINYDLNSKHYLPDYVIKDIFNYTYSFEKDDIPFITAQIMEYYIASNYPNL